MSHALWVLAFTAHCQASLPVRACYWSHCILNAVSAVIVIRCGLIFRVFSLNSLTDTWAITAPIPTFSLNKKLLPLTRHTRSWTHTVSEATESATRLQPLMLLMQHYAITSPALRYGALLKNNSLHNIQIDDSAMFWGRVTSSWTQGSHFEC